jgi:uncharacterized membrane protein (UPF0127 family)
LKLRNETNGALLAEQIERASSLHARLTGLLGRRALPEGCGLAIEPCNSVHTFFMRFAIDVVFLDERGIVVRAIASLKPWRATRIHRHARAAVELPPGTIERTATSEGHRLAFV